MVRVILGTGATALFALLFSLSPSHLRIPPFPSHGRQIRSPSAIPLSNISLHPSTRSSLQPPILHPPFLHFHHILTPLLSHRRSPHTTPPPRLRSTVRPDNIHLHRRFLILGYLLGCQEGVGKIICAVSGRVYVTLSPSLFSPSQPPPPPSSTQTPPD